MRAALRHFLHGLSAYRPLLFILLLGLLGLSLSRMALFAAYAERIQQVPDWPLLLLTGVRADLIVIGYMLAIPLLIAPLLLLPPFNHIWQRFLQSWLVVSLLLLFFMEAATPAFIAQYDVRPNRLFIEYLLYPREVMSTLWNGFRGWLLLTVLFTIAAVWFLRRVARSQRVQPKRTRYSAALLVWPLLVLLTAIAIRSTFDHRPANPAFFARTGDALVNSLTISSAYSVEFALYNMQHEESASDQYGKVSEDELKAFISEIDYLKEARFPYPEYPTVHWQQASQERTRPLNIVIILQESLGFGFYERGLTPELARWSEEGWWFEQLYATGTRSVRGIEAVVAGFLPTPARSTVKLGLSQRNFFTLADVLQRHGYHTEFIYGGESHFDNMRSFFTGNGFASIIDENDFRAPNFVSTWGVSDEDLFDKAHERFSELQQQQQAFFSLVFTSSNHEPFELPPNKITPVSGVPQQSVENAVKYADFALGNFLQQAKSSSYWDNTLFLVVADHDNRVYGDALVPVDKFHIPSLILGADIKPQRLNAIASQVDLAPTLLSLAGVSAYVPTLGQDLSAGDAPANRAFLQFNQTFAYLEGATGPAEITILRPDTEPLLSTYNIPQRQLGELQPAPTQKATQALAWATLPSWLYREQRYYVPLVADDTTNQRKEVASSAE
ncbi:LTA synthase family protein [Pseudidiomarina sp.]|uniref:LTA synthase family protein n=1 Tax=Pseudidiomarina sp. TaxID=2081707 RepID=UPI003A9846E5